MFDLISWIIFGFFVAIVAKMLMPGRIRRVHYHRRFGIAGSLLGGLISKLLEISGGWLTGFAMPVIGAILLLRALSSLSRELDSTSLTMAE